MEDATGDVTSPVKSPAKRHASPPKEPAEKTKAQAPAEEAKAQIQARISGAVALVAAEFQVSVQEVSRRISVVEGYQFSVEKKLDLFEALKIGYARAVTVQQLVDKLCNLVGVDFDPLYHFTDWYKVYDAALAKNVDPLTAMKEHFEVNAKTESKPRSDPKPFRNQTEEERKKMFKPGAKPTRSDVQKLKQDKARENKVKKAREAKIDKDVTEQFGSGDDDDDDGDVSVADMY